LDSGGHPNRRATLAGGASPGIRPSITVSPTAATKACPRVGAMRDRGKRDALRDTVFGRGSRTQPPGGLRPR